MRPSRVGTITVPGVSTNQPVGFVAAAERPLRVICRNVGGTLLRLSFESASLGAAGANTVDHFQLPGGQSEVFILAPRQTLYVVGAGGGGFLSYAASEAYPFSTEG